MLKFVVDGYNACNQLLVKRLKIVDNGVGDDVDGVGDDGGDDDNGVREEKELGRHQVLGACPYCRGNVQTVDVESQ
ncbi:hypothetical protein F0562_011364 [Nyssa sinensis]|uniref:Uncharacterized protein n=1 Tax=Nyssa sinensis TaxID=561372 RepID=A0A5J5A4Y2_9ASTE|nr:hypothetical protein F0562_011364 [Nyssa sinensis]